MITLENIISYLRQKEPYRLIPILDRAIVILFRFLYVVTYFILRISFRFVLGKERRDKLWIKKKWYFNFHVDIIPLNYYLNILQFISKHFRTKKKLLLKVTVPLHDYKIYTTLNKTHMLS